jgi:hypothetical protein
LENQSNNPNNNETKEQKQERAFQQALVYFIAERTLAETDKEPRSITPGRKRPYPMHYVEKR